MNNLMTRLLCVACLVSAGSAIAAAQPVKELLEAIRSGEFDRVPVLLETHDDAKQLINARDGSGNTVLMHAALYAPSEVVALLLTKGADPNAANVAGATPLMRAGGDLRKVQLLLAAGAHINARSELGNTSLILAARRPGAGEVVELLLDKGADVNAANKFGVTALMAATAANDLASMKLLLKHGADVNANPRAYEVDPIWGGGRTPLMWAAFLGNAEAATLLLSHGADPNRQGLFGSPLSQASWGNQTALAELLIAAGADVAQKDEYPGYTPLHWAADSERSQADLVQMFLRSGADRNAEGGQPVDAFLGVVQTPLSLAQKRGHEAILTALGIPPLEPSSTASNAGKNDSLHADSSVPSDSLRRAIETALAPLQKTAGQSRQAFLKHSTRQDCISCHQQNLPMAAVGTARLRGLKFDEVAALHQLRLAIQPTGVVGDPNKVHADEIFLQATFHPEPAHSIGYLFFGLHAERQPSSPVLDAYIYHLMAIQDSTGRWCNNLPRPPLQSGDIGATALVIFSLNNYAPPCWSAEAAERIDLARRWLWSVRPETTDERIYHLLGLHWAGSRSDQLEPLGKLLLNEQREDGGWGQLKSLDSDAYATGQALYALTTTGLLSKREPSFRRGLRYLLESQLPDGSWHVKRRAFPFQPTMDSGFPHGRDSWISAAGTSWAVMALSQGLDPAATVEFPRIGYEESPPPEMLARHVLEVPYTPERSDQNPLPASGPPIDFLTQIKPLLEKSCVACHSGERAKGGLRMVTRDDLLKPASSGEPAVLLGQGAKSHLVRYARDEVQELEMPPPAKRDRFPKLSMEATDLLARWIDQGAPWPEGELLQP